MPPSRSAKTTGNDFFRALQMLDTFAAHRHRRSAPAASSDSGNSPMPEAKGGVDERGLNFMLSVVKGAEPKDQVVGGRRRRSQLAIALVSVLLVVGLATICFSSGFQRRRGTPTLSMRRYRSLGLRTDSPGALRHLLCLIGATGLPEHIDLVSSGLLLCISCIRADREILSIRLSASRILASPH